jgi:hypothetical protein
MTRPMNEVLAESLRRRGINIANWPADEAAEYRAHGGFHEGEAAVEAIRFQKAADALSAEGYGNVAEAHAKALEEFADFITNPKYPGLDARTLNEVALEARHRAAALREPTAEEAAA